MAKEKIYNAICNAKYGFNHDVMDEASHLTFNGNLTVQEAIVCVLRRMWASKNMSIVDKIAYITVARCGELVDGATEINFVLPATKDACEEFRKIERKMKKRNPVWMPCFSTMDMCNESYWIHEENSWEIDINSGYERQISYTRETGYNEEV